MAYITDQHILDLGLDPTDDTTTRRTLADTGLVYDYVGEHPWATRGDLDKWAEQTWSTEAPDRLNAALAVLITAGRVYDIGQVSRQTPITT